MQVLTRGFLLSDALEKGGHPGRREGKLSSHAFSTDWREFFVPEPSSHANYLLNLSITCTFKVVNKMMASLHWRNKY